MIIEQLTFFPHLAKTVTVTPNGYGKVICEEFSGENFETYENRYCISYIEEGSGWFVLNDKKYRIQSGDLFFAPQYMPNIHYADDGTVLKIYWVIFMSDCDMKNFKERPVIHAPEAESVFVNMVSQDYADIETLYKTTSHILRLMCLFMEYNAVERKTNHSRNMHLTHYTLAYICANYSKECSLLDIANNLHIDRNYLTKIFKQETGFTPKQYLKACRVYYGALMMLKHPGATVTNISDEIGYSDVSNFRKAFETNLKVSVSYYRRLSDKDKIKCVSEFCREYAFPNPSVT